MAMVNGADSRQRLDHRLGLNFKRIAWSDELDVIRPSVERIAELRLLRLQEREANRDFVLKQITAFKSNGLWAHCKETAGDAAGAVRYDCLCQHEVTLGESVLAVDPRRLTNILERPRRHRWPFCSCCSRQMFRYEEPTPAEIFAHPALSGAIRVAAQAHLSDDFADLDRFSEAYGRAVVRVTTLLLDMRAKMNRYVVQFTGWLFRLVLPRFFSRLIVSERDIATLRQIHAEGLSLVYVPLHRSHLDYILLPFVLWHHNLPLPFVAAGDNLKIPVLSSLLRRFGGFFIRRKSPSGGGMADDGIYRALLQTYIERLLTRGQSLEFYLEAGRSRTGRTRTPKTGILSMVNAACIRGPVPDVYLVPMSIGYENPPDVNFADERLGNAKPKETLWSTLCSFWQFLRMPRGLVRFSFCRPVRLSQFRASLALRRSEITPASSSSPAAPGEDNMCGALAQHALFFATQQQPCMTTHLLAFLLLTQHRAGASADQLALSFDRLAAHLRLSAVLGFHEATPGADAVAWAARLLAPLLVVERTPVGRLAWVAPRLSSVPAALNLAYFANAVTALVALDAVRACALVRVRGAAAAPELALPGRLYDDVPTPPAPADLYTAAAERLLRLLGHDFIFWPPCIRPDVALARDSRLWRLMTATADPGYLDRRRREVGVSPGRGRDAEHDAAVNVDLGHPDTAALLEWLCTALGPVLEAYWVTCRTLYELRLGDTWTETECMRSTMRAMRRRHQQQLLIYVESQCSETVRACLKSLEEGGIIERCHANSSTVSVSLLDCEALCELLQLIESCMVRPTEKWARSDCCRSPQPTC